MHGRLAFEDRGSSINLRMTNDTALMNALALASLKWPNGFECNGSPEFQTKVARMAKAMGVNPQRQLPREVP